MDLLLILYMINDDVPHGSNCSYKFLTYKCLKILMINMKHIKIYWDKIKKNHTGGQECKETAKNDT